MTATDNTAENADLTTQINKDPRSALWPTYAPPVDIVFSHGLGTELFTTEGARYLDFISGIAVTSFGHAHPRLIEALSEQTAKLWHLSNMFRIPATENLAKKLTQHSFGSRVFFTNSGAEACEAGIKALRGYHAVNGNPQRHRIISLSGAFHGRTLGTIAAAANPAHTKGFIPCDYGFDQVPWGDLDALEQAINDQTAGVILETIQGEGGIRPATAEFMRGVRALCDKHGILMMLDEVQCGIGRSGKLFAYENYDVTPDVMALAKGIGGGFPVGACIATESVSQAMQIGTHGTTYGGNPLAAAVASTVIDLLLEGDTLSEIQRKGKLLRQRLEALVTQYPEQLKGVSGLGLMLGLECVIPNTELLVKLRENRLLVGKAGSNMVRLLPPLNVSDEHLNEACDIIESTLDSFTVAQEK